MSRKLIVPPDIKPSTTDRIGQYLRTHVIDQERAIKEILRSLHRGEAGLQNPNHPLGVFLFLGPTGVGKTHTAVELSNALKKKVWRCRKFAECGYETTFRKGSDPNAKPTTMVICPVHKDEAVGLEEVELPSIWKMDCGQLSDHKSPVNHLLLGSPLGYIDHEKTPFFHGKAPKVVLFDEIEKAIVPKNWWEGTSGLEDILLKIMQNGRITNNKPEEVDFTESFIIMTGNLGTREINEELGKSSMGFLLDKNQARKISQLDDEEIEKLNEKIYRIIKGRVEKELPPEFINRIDKLVVFRFLTKKSYLKIFDREASLIQKRIDKSPVPFKLEFLTETKLFLIDEAFSDRQYGANPLGRLLEEELVSELAKLTTHQIISQGSTVQIGLENNKLTFLEKEVAAAQEGAR